MSNVNNYIKKQLIQTKSVEFMLSFYFSLFALLGSLLWLAYGTINRDIIIMVIDMVLSIYVESVVYKLNHIIYCMFFIFCRHQTLLECHWHWVRWFYIVSIETARLFKTQRWIKTSSWNRSQKK